MSNEEKELLRHAALETLAARHPAALPLSGIARRVRTEVDFSFPDTELAAALDLLKGLGLVQTQYDELGASMWYQATAAGVLKVERRP